MDRDLTCAECGALKVRTVRGAVLCPNGHGKLLPMSQSQYQKARRATIQFGWSAKFPAATKSTEFKSSVGYVIAGHDGKFKKFAREVPPSGKQQQSRKTSRLKFGEVVPEEPGGLVAASIGDRVFIFTRIVKRSRKAKAKA